MFNPATAPYVAIYLEPFKAAAAHEAREISTFECAVCGETIENWNSAWVPRYRFIACPAKNAE
jgi:hypothetical protein